MLARFAATGLLAAQCGADIQFEHRTIGFKLENAESLERYAPETMAGGVALFDCDGDGDLDLFLANGADLPDNVKSSSRFHNRLYSNDGSGQFTDDTERAGLQGLRFSFGAAVGDYDNDGDEDLFVAGLHGNQLYENDGSGRFTDITSDAGLRSNDADHGPLWSITGAWMDYDRDGLLDLLVVNYLAWAPGVDPVCDGTGVRDYCHPKHYKGTPNSLYRNQGNGTFVDVSESSGIRSKVGKGMGASVADFDKDGFVDVFVTNDKLPNFLFRNDGQGRFDEIAFESTIALAEHGRAISGMGLDARDIDNDGLVDVVYTALPGESFPLMRNTPDGYFEDITHASGLAAQVRDMAGYSALIADFDNDGRKDLFFSLGDVQTHPIDPTVPVHQHNTVFRAMEDGTFAATAESAGFTAAPARRHRGAAVGDLDGDGRLDLVVTALGEETELWLNASDADAHWLAIDLQGRISNRNGIGAVVQVTSNGTDQFNTATTSVGYASSSSGPVHFGLGAAETVQQIKVHWPSGIVQSAGPARSGQVLRLVEPAER